MKTIKSQFAHSHNPKVSQSHNSYNVTVSQYHNIIARLNLVKRAIFQK